MIPNDQAANLAPVTGADVDKLFSLKGKYADRQKVADAAKAEYDAFEAELIARMTHHKLDKAGGRRATVSLAVQYYPSVTDWDAIWNVVRKEKTYPALLQRRISDALWREMYKDRKLLAGTEAFQKIKLSLTAVKK